MDLMTMKQTKGFQPNDFVTPKSSTKHTPLTALPARPTQTAHGRDRESLPLPISSAFNSDVPIPSSPSPHYRQTDHDGFAIPALPPHRRFTSGQDRSLDNLPTSLPSSALASVQHSQSRQFASYGTQPSRAVLEAFLQADKANRTPSKNQARNASAPRLSADSESPAGRGRDPTPGASARPRKNRDLFTAASDIPSRERVPRARAHSVVGVTHATRTDDFASDSYFTSTTPRASGSRFEAGSAVQPIRDELDFSSVSLSIPLCYSPHVRPADNRHIHGSCVTARRTHRHLALDRMMPKFPMGLPSGAGSRSRGRGGVNFHVIRPILCGKSR